MAAIKSLCSPRSFTLMLVAIGFVSTGSVLALDPAKTLNQYVHQVWTAQNGLPADELQAITQTRDGYLWIGTEEGLARFDGGRFAVFDKASGQLPGNFVYSLLEDSSGSLWIGTDGGLVCYRDGKFKALGREAGLSNATGIAQDRMGTLWVSANYKLWRYQANRFTCFDPLEQQRDFGGVIDVTVDTTDNVWVVLKGGIVCWFRDNRFEPVPQFGALRGQALERISSDRQGKVWISDYSGGAYSYRAGEIERFGRSEGLSGVPASRIVRGQDGTVWMGTDLGLARITNGKCTEFQSNGKDALRGINVVYEDRENNLWAGGDGQGLQRFTDGSFTVFRPKQGVPDATVSGICEDAEHNLWLATSDGIYRGRDHFELVLDAKDRLGGDFIWVQLTVDPRDRSLWIGTMHGLFHYECVTGRLTRYTASDGLPSDAVMAQFLDHEGGLWIGCDGGLVYLKDGRFTIPEPLQRLTHGKIIRNIVEDHNGGIWIGAPAGPILYKKGAITQFGTKDGLVSALCRAIYVGSDGTVWVSTWNGGLSVYTGNGFFTYSQMSGLPSDDITGMTDDPARGDLWLGSNKGVFRVSKKQLYDFRTGRVSHIFGTLFGVEDGLSSPAITDNGKPVVTRAEDGRLWWSTNQGAAVVDPGNLILHNAPGPPLIESILADGQTLRDGNLALPPGIRRLEIDYASLTYAAADKLQFRYRLDGVDRDWFDAGQHREAIFTNLGPGDYRFRVQVSADRGATWNGPAAEMGFSVRPYFYQTWWFLGGCAAAVLAIAWAAYVLRRRNLELHFRAMIAERVRVAGEIHDSLAQGFASAAMLLDSLDRIVPSDSPLRHRLKSIRAILGTSLKDARAMIATLRGQPEQSEDLESALRKLAARLAPVSSAPIALEFGDQRMPPVPAAVQQELVGICQEGLNNAIRHANANHIWVTLSNGTGQSIRLAIRDDGNGFDVSGVTASPEGAHFGLLGLSERAKRIGAKLDIRSEPGAGTEIELHLPLMKRGTHEFVA